MEENLKTNIEETTENAEVVSPVEETSTTKTIEEVEKNKSNDSIEISFYNIMEYLLYIIGIVLIVMCFIKLGEDLETYRGEYRFEMKSYVGGDAYNYIIAAARSTAVMVKSLIYAVLGSSSIISGLLIRISSKK